MNEQVKAIREEIVRQKKYSRTMSDNAISGYMRNFFDGADDMCNQLLNFIDSLPDEQLNKDLEDEIATWIQSHLEIKNEQFEIYREPMTKWAEAIARHFYELGQHSKIPASKDLGEAAEKHADNCLDIKFPTLNKDLIRSDVIYSFKLGANWQAEHTEDFPMPEDTVLFQKGVAEGKRLMMENAIEGRVIETYNPVTEEGKPDLHGITLIYEDKNKPYLTVGDIFKFTIINED